MTEHFNHWLPKALNVLAITIGTHIFYSLKEVHTPMWLRKHEQEHVKQNIKDGFITFQSRYICQYFALRIRGYNHEKAHDMIDYEKQAIRSERNDEGELY